MYGTYFFIISPDIVFLFQLSGSTATRLHLSSLRLLATSTFLFCEAITLPYFAVHRSAPFQLRVARLPDGAPKLSRAHGVQDGQGRRASARVRLGDQLVMDCESRGANPAPNITWFVNGDLVNVLKAFFDIFR